MGIIARLLGLGRANEASGVEGKSQSSETQSQVSTTGVNENRATAEGSEVRGNINQGCSCCGGKGCSCCGAGSR